MYKQERFLKKQKMTSNHAELGAKRCDKAIFSPFFEKNVWKSLQVREIMSIFAPKNVTLPQEAWGDDVKKSREIREKQRIYNFFLFIN